jgi:signal transduction histidine kinase
MASRPLIVNIDDTAELRYVKTRILRQAGYEVVEGTTGGEALRLVRELLPQLVVCDVKLPDMSGVDVCRRIKNDPVTGSIPVVQISATFVAEKDAEEALKGGADIYLTEPLEPRELETVVSVLLRLRRSEADELRTPMNIIIGWAHLLRAGPLNDEQKLRAAEAIERAARSQAQLIEDLLDVSRIVTGKFRLRMQDLDVAAVLRMAVESLRPVAQAKGVVLRVSQPESIATVRGDQDRLQQVFWNLLSNAVKFTPANGCVDVELEQTDGHVRIRVTDTGIGIAREFLPYVFDRFRQADSTSTRAHTGMGLGLAIVRHVVELHGGSVSADSQGENTGSTFTVTLPTRSNISEHQEDAKESSEADLASSVGLGTRVLLIEDDPDAREVIATGLERAGFEIRPAGSAREALSMLDHWHPDVIVSDIGMPGMDGYEFIRALRTRTPDRSGHVAALALTAFARLEDVALARASGYDGHLSKPVNPRELAGAIIELRRRRGYVRHP